MRVTQSKQVAVTGVITVSVTVTSKAYVGLTVTARMIWDTAAGPFDGVCYWGDGAYDLINTTSKRIDKTHIYSTVGTYTIKAVITDRYTGARGEDTASIKIAAKLSATLYPSPSSGPLPLAVTLNCSATGGYLNYSWALNPGDGSSPYSGTRTAGGGWTQNHTYNKVGTFSATLTVTDALGTGTVTKTAILAGITSWWDAVKTWWNGLARWQKALIVASSVGGVIVGGASLSKRG